MDANVRYKAMSMVSEMVRQMDRTRDELARTGGNPRQAMRHTLVLCTGEQFQSPMSWIGSSVCASSMF